MTAEFLWLGFSSGDPAGTIVREKFASLPAISTTNKPKCDADGEAGLLRDGFIVLITTARSSNV